MRLHNRQIKASFWADSELLRWPLAKRFFYAGLANLADDSGCLEDDPFAYKIHLFPSPIDADITIELLTIWRDELVQAGKLIAYTADGKACLYMANFHKHQHLDNPAAPEVPLPAWIIWSPFPSNKRQGKYVISDSKDIIRDTDLTDPLHIPYTSLTDDLQTPSNQNQNQNNNPIPPLSPPQGEEEPPVLDLEIEQPEDDARAGDGDVYTAEFEAFWAAYPRRPNDGKRKAFNCWHTLQRLRTRDRPAPDDLIQAASNYRRYCDEQRTEPGFIKRASTFLSCKDRPFEEWVGEYEAIVHTARQQRSRTSEGGGARAGRHLPEDPKRAFEQTGHRAFT